MVKKLFFFLDLEAKMPDRFKVTKSDAPEIDATYHSILKDDDAAVLGKLLPTPTVDEKKGELLSFILCSVYPCFAH